MQPHAKGGGHTVLCRDASSYAPSGVSGQPERWVDGTLRFPFWLLSFRDPPSFGSLRFDVLLLRARKTGSATRAPAALRATAGVRGRKLKAVKSSLQVFAPPGVYALPESSFFFFLFPPLCLQVSAFSTKFRCYSCFLQGTWSGSMLLGHYKKQKSWALFYTVMVNVGRLNEVSDQKEIKG